MLGNIKNETTTPQVELLFRKRFMDVTSGFYWDRQGLYAPSEGSGVQPYYRGCCGTSSDSGCTVTWSSEGVMTDDCPEGQRCQYHTGICFPPNVADIPIFSGDGITSYECGQTITTSGPAKERLNPTLLGGNIDGATLLYDSSFDEPGLIEDPAIGLFLSLGGLGLGIWGSLTKKTIAKWLGWYVSGTGAVYSYYCATNQQNRESYVERTYLLECNS